MVVKDEHLTIEPFAWSLSMMANLRRCVLQVPERSSTKAIRHKTYIYSTPPAASRIDTIFAYSLDRASDRGVCPR